MKKEDGEEEGQGGQGSGDGGKGRWGQDKHMQQREEPICIPIKSDLNYSSLSTHTSRRHSAGKADEERKEKGEGKREKETRVREMLGERTRGRKGEKML